MKRTAVSLLLVFLSSASSALWAAGPMKPGLWEMTVKSDSLKNMPQIPPEQLDRMRQMGITVPQIGNGGMVTRVCISKAMAEREAPPTQQHQSDCETRNFHRSGSSYSLDIVCNGPDMKGKGKVVGTYSGNTKFESTYDFRGTMHGNQTSQHTETSGRWLGTACGSVRPADEMMPGK